MDPTPTSQDTPIASRNTRCTKTDDENLTDLTFPTSQNTPIFDTNGSKDDDANLIVLVFPTFQDMPVWVNNDNNNLTGVRNEFEALKIFLMEEFIEITLRHGCSPVNVLHNFRTPSPNNVSGGLRMSPKKYAKQTTLNTHALITKIVLIYSVNLASPNEDLNCPKKPVIISDSLLKHVSGAKLNRDVENFDPEMFESEFSYSLQSFQLLDYTRFHNVFLLLLNKFALFKKKI